MGIRWTWDCESQCCRVKEPGVRRDKMAVVENLEHHGHGGHLANSCVEGMQRELMASPKDQDCADNGVLEMNNPGLILLQRSKGPSSHFQHA